MRKKGKITQFLLFLAMIALSVFLYFSRRIYWKYDDQWIIGKREWEIVERYGKFDYETKPGARKGYYIGQENHFFETHRKKLYYFILLITIIKLKSRDWWSAGKRLIDCKGNIGRVSCLFLSKIYSAS